MQARAGDLYTHKHLGCTYLVTRVSRDVGADIECVNLEIGKTCSINSIAWRVFYKPLTHTQETP
jgi:hypothetical protein